MKKEKPPKDPNQREAWEAKRRQRREQQLDRIEDVLFQWLRFGGEADSFEIDFPERGVTVSVDIASKPFTGSGDDGTVVP